VNIVKSLHQNYFITLSAGATKSNTIVIVIIATIIISYNNL